MAGAHACPWTLALLELTIVCDWPTIISFTVPVLWDTKTETIVNNESSEIIRMLNSEFNNFLSGEQKDLNLYPESVRSEIDTLNDWVYDTVNSMYLHWLIHTVTFLTPLHHADGVYKAGVATTQSAYEDAVKALFTSLDRLEKILDEKEYLFGNKLTEADVRLYTTIIRFDPVYHGHFKCNIGTIRV